jgi:hypothetical protein
MASASSAYGIDSLYRMLMASRMRPATVPGKVRCAIYTRVSTEQGLDQDSNSLDAQFEAAVACIKSQADAGWTLIRSI